MKEDYFSKTLDVSSNNEERPERVLFLVTGSSSRDDFRASLNS